MRLSDQRIFAPTGFAFRVTTVMKPNQTLMQQSLHPNDVIPDMERLNVVYHVPCVNCHATYVEETKKETWQEDE